MRKQSVEQARAMLGILKPESVMWTTINREFAKYDKSLGERVSVAQWVNLFVFRGQ
jgi:hypothetical protein